MNYSHEIKEAVSNGIFKREEIFEWDGSPFEEILDNYYKFCRESLNIVSKQVNINPNVFVINNSFSVNAEAGRTKDCFYIAINFGLLKYCNDNYQENDGLREYFEKKFPLTSTKFDHPANFLAFQICTQFTYYHELAHLFQFSDAVKSASIQERTDANVGADFSNIYHILEINADTYASVAVATHIGQYIERIFKEDVTLDNTAETFIFFCCCLLNYTLGFTKSAEPIYFEEHSHPHSFIRLINSILNIVNHVENSPYFKEKKIDLQSRNLFRTVLDTYKDLEKQKIFKTNVFEIIEENADLQQKLAQYLHSLIQFDTKEYVNAMEIWNSNIN